MKQVTAHVISNSEVMPGVYLIWLESPQIASAAQPGQFIMVHCGEETLLRRPLSIHQVANNSKLAFLVNVVGKGTHWLAQCQVGDNIDLLGPLGNRFSIHPESDKLLLLAGGIGIAPLRFLADEAVKRGRSVTLLYGTPTAHRYPEDLLPPQIKLVTVSEDGSAGKKGLITDLLPDFIDWADQIFACGPLPMYQAMTQIAELKDTPVQVSLETRMGCGRGICYGCTVKTRGGLKQVCWNGPVFSLDDVLWDELAD